MISMNENDPKAAFGVPMRASLRQWIKIEAARRGVRIQDLMDEIVQDAKNVTEGRR